MGEFSFEMDQKFFSVGDARDTVKGVHAMTPFGRTLKPSKEIIILLKYLRLSLCIEYVTLQNQQRRRNIGMKQVVVRHLAKL